mgnify:CR=1 FL=1
MVFNINNFFDDRSRKSKIADFQDLDHIDGVSISTVSANLYDQKRDDLVLFYFRDGASYASVFTQSKIVSENIKWNKKIKSKKIIALLINTRNANALTGSSGFVAIKELATDLSNELTEKQKLDEEFPKEIKSNEILFACTGTIGEKFPLNKIKNTIPNLIKNIKYTQNKLIWIKAAMGIITTDTKPKLAMSECKIGSTNIKIYGIAKGSGMIHPNLTKAYKISDPVYYFDISLTHIHSKCFLPTLFKPFSRYPSIRRDIAVIIPKWFSYADITAVFNQFKPKLATHFYLFDLLYLNV